MEVLIKIAVCVCVCVCGRGSSQVVFPCIWMTHLALASLELKGRTLTATLTDAAMAQLTCRSQSESSRNRKSRSASCFSPPGHLRSSFSALCLSHTFSSSSSYLSLQHRLSLFLPACSLTLLPSFFPLFHVSTHFLPPLLCYVLSRHHGNHTSLFYLCCHFFSPSFLNLKDPVLTCVCVCVCQ